MKRTYVEISCDQCQHGDFYRPGSVNDDARKNGWTITRDGKHFCTKKCMEDYRIKPGYVSPNDKLSGAAPR